MVYDCRSDHLVPGLSLWNHQKLKEDTQNHPQPSVEVKFISENTVDGKASALDMNAGLQLSFVAGLVDVSGAAQFLQNDMASDETLRITMQYKCTTQFDQLSMAQLNKNNIQHPDVLDRDLATHVITGILFGANAHLIFDLQTSVEDSKIDMEIKLKAAVQSIPNVAIGGNVGSKVGQEHKSITERIKVTFYGDFQPSLNPTNYDQALELFRNLPTELGKDFEKAIPIKVWLYPLHYFKKDAITLGRGISPSLLAQASNCLEQLQYIVMKCKNLGDSNVCKTFAGVVRRLKTFRTMVEEYKAVFKAQLATLLPKIRRGTTDTDTDTDTDPDTKNELEKLILRLEESPFRQEYLFNWVENYRDQIQIMGSYLDTLAKPTDKVSACVAKDSGDLLKVIMSPSYVYCLCFTMQLNQSNTVLDNMKKHLRQRAPLPSPQNNPDLRTVDTNTETTESLRLSPDGFNSMARKATLFKEFHGANVDSASTAFIVAEAEKVTELPGCFIKLYKYGKEIYPDFELPSQPAQPTCDSDTSPIKVTWKKPENGAEQVTKYKLLYKRVRSRGRWHEHESAKDEFEFSLPDVKCGVRYKIKVVAVCEVGSSLTSSTTEIRIPGPCTCTNLSRHSRRGSHDMQYNKVV
jgi:hypothetical protein